MFEIIKAVGEARSSRKQVFEVLLKSDNSEILQVMEFFSALVAKAFAEPLEIFLDYLIGATELNGYRSPYLEYYTKTEGYQAFSLYESLSSLRGKLRKHFGEKKLRLVDLISLVDD